MRDDKNGPTKPVEYFKERMAREIDELMPRLVQLSKDVYAFCEMEVEPDEYVAR